MATQKITLNELKDMIKEVMTEGEGVYGNYGNWVDSGFISKEEAAAKARVDWRKKQLINALNMYKNADHNEKRDAEEIIKSFLPF